MGKKILLGAIIVLVIALAGFSGFFVSQPLAGLESGEKPINIGVIFPLSGKYAVTGEQSGNGILLAEKKINDGGGINGRPVRLILEDNKSEKKDATTAIQKLLNADNIDIVIGGQTSAMAVVLAPIAEENKKLFLSTTATHKSLNQLGPYSFKLQEGNPGHVDLALEIMRKKGVKRLGFIYLQTDFAKEVLGLMEENAAEKGISLVAIESYMSEDTDFRGQLTKIRQAKPDAIYIAGYYEDSALVLKQARELGMEQQFFGHTTMFNPKFLNITGNASEGVIITTYRMECDESEETEFCRNYSKEFGGLPSSYHAGYAYDALMIVAEAIRKAESTDPEVLKWVLPGIELNGVTGKTSFDSEGNAKKQLVAKEVSNGEFVLYQR